jgi:hypothetical protein
MRRTVGVIAWGVLGAVVAVVLISGAFVVAGSSLTQPASAVRVGTSTPLRANTPDRHENDPNATDDAPTPSASTATVEPSSVAASVVHASTVPVPTPSKDGGAERGDD